MLYTAFVITEVSEQVLLGLSLSMRPVKHKNHTAPNKSCGKLDKHVDFYYMN